MGALSIFGFGSVLFITVLLSYFAYQAIYHDFQFVYFFSYRTKAISTGVISS
jgi:hypothetical protein